MKYTVLAYYDKDITKFNPPMTVPFAVDDAKQSIIEGVIKGKIEDAKSFDLYHLGTYDTENGQFDLLAEPVKLLDLSKYIRE